MAKAAERVCVEQIKLKTMIIDTHVHYNLPPLSENWQIHWQQAQAHGIEKSVVVGTSFESIDKAVENVASEPNLFMSFGIHPHIIRDQILAEQEVLSATEVESKFIDLLSKHQNKVVAIGEIGLDYFRLDEDAPESTTIKQAQRTIFRIQLQLAVDHQLPVILHVRDKSEPVAEVSGNAYWDALEIVKEFKLSKFVLHCASGSNNYVSQMIELGAYLGFDGNISYPKAEHIRDLFILTPDERRLLETDAPYLPPQQYRGQVCEPWMVKLTADYIRDTLNADLKQIYMNSRDIFEI